MLPEEFSGNQGSLAQDGVADVTVVAGACEKVRCDLARLLNVSERRRSQVGQLIQVVAGPSAEAGQFDAPGPHSKSMQGGSGQRRGNDCPRSDSGRGPNMRRSASAMGTSLLLASRRFISPSASNSHSSLP